MKHILVALPLALALQDGSAPVEASRDLAKRLVELPVKVGLASLDLPPLPETTFLSKGRVELPLKLTLERSSGLGPAELPPLADAVQPGDVRWHPSYEHALAAAGTSGKPVLLFQLLGRLDAGFC